MDSWSAPIHLGPRGGRRDRRGRDQPARRRRADVDRRGWAAPRAPSAGGEFGASEDLGSGGRHDARFSASLAVADDGHVTVLRERGRTAGVIDGPIAGPLSAPEGVGDDASPLDSPNLVALGNGGGTADRVRRRTRRGHQRRPRAELRAPRRGRPVRGGRPPDRLRPVAGARRRREGSGARSMDHPRLRLGNDSTSSVHSALYGEPADAVPAEETRAATRAAATRTVAPGSSRSASATGSACASAAGWPLTAGIVRLRMSFAEAVTGRIWITDAFGQHGRGEDGSPPPTEFRSACGSAVPALGPSASSAAACSGCRSITAPDEADGRQVRALGATRLRGRETRVDTASRRARIVERRPP